MDDSGDARRRELGLGVLEVQSASALARAEEVRIMAVVSGSLMGTLEQDDVEFVRGPVEYDVKGNHDEDGGGAQ